MTTTLKDQAKAIVAGGVAAVATALTAYFAGTDEMSWRGVVGAAVAGLAAYGGTYYTRNATDGTRTPQRRPWTPRRDEAGQIERMLLLAVLVLALIALFVFLFDFQGR